MKKIGKALLMVSLVSSFAFSSTLVSLAGQWQQQANGQYKYLNDDGSYATSCLVDGYYLNGDGIWLEDIKLDNNIYGWKNEKVVMEMGSEIQKEKEWKNNPIVIYSSYGAGFGDGNDVIEISKNGNSYDLTLRTRIQTDTGKKALRALTYLLCDDDTLYNAIYNSYEGDNDFYNINYDNFVQVGNYQIKATLGQNGNSMIYIITEN